MKRTAIGARRPAASRAAAESSGPERTTTHQSGDLDHASLRPLRAAAEIVGASPRSVAQRSRIRQSFGAEHADASAGVVQRVMKKRVEENNYAFADAGARFESTKNRGDKQGRKPLLVIPTTTNQVDLHVHLIPVNPPKAFTGWNLKDTAAGSHLLKDNSTQLLDQEDAGLFNQKAAGWNVPASYPADVSWANESQAERALRGEQVFAERRKQYVGFLAEKLDNHVKKLLNREPVDLTLEYKTRARKKGETRTRFVEAIEAAKSLPVVDGVAARHTIVDSGSYRVVFRFATCADLEKHRGSILDTMDEAPAKALAWTRASESSTAESVRQASRSAAQAYIAQVEQGDHDDTVRNWSGDRRDVTFA